MSRFLRAATLLSALLFASSASADCECGYTVNGTLYTDLSESDFLHMNNVNQSGWLPQKYQTSPEVARGPFGKDASPQQVIFNPLKSRYDWAGEGIHGGDAGVQIIVRAGDPGDGGLIPMGEMATNRTDMLYGTFRAGLKLTGQPGTCGAFFWVCIITLTHHLLLRLADRRPCRSTSMTRKRSTWSSCRRNSTRPLIQSTWSFSHQPPSPLVSTPPIPTPFNFTNYPSTPLAASMNIALTGSKITSIFTPTVSFYEPCPGAAFHLSPGI